MTSNATAGTVGVTQTLTVLPLTFMTAALFMTLRNMPIMAETGLHMIFFNLVTVLAFLLPIAIVSAELATGWPENGVYGWVGAAFGQKAGFLAVWLQWTQSLFGMTSILAYVGGTLAYVFAPSLGQNRFFVAGTIIIVYWVATFLNFKGTARSGMISSVALAAGVLLPSVLLIIAAAAFVIAGNTIEMNLTLSTENIFPSLTNTAGLVLFLSFVFGFVGIEVSAGHAREVVNPQKNYPRALFVAAILGFVITLLGGMAIGAVMPVDKINSINGATQAFSALMTHFNLSWVVPIVAFLIALGAAGQVSTWVVGPVRGIRAAGKDGYVQADLLVENEYGVPKRLLIIQAFLISALGLLFVIFGNVDTIFLLLTSIAIILYAVMYVMMFAAAIRLRYTHPDVHRAYRVPGGNFGMWLVCSIGGATAALCFAIGFIPPSPNPIGLWTFEIAIAGLCAVTVLVGWILIRRNKHTINFAE